MSPSTLLLHSTATQLCPCLLKPIHQSRVPAPHSIRPTRRTCTCSSSSSSNISSNITAMGGLRSTLLGHLGQGWQDHQGSFLHPMRSLPCHRCSFMPYCKKLGYRTPAKKSYYANTVAVPMSTHAPRQLPLCASILTHMNTNAGTSRPNISCAWHQWARDKPIELHGSR